VAAPSDALATINHICAPRPRCQNVVVVTVAAAAAAETEARVLAIIYILLIILYTVYNNNNNIVIVILIILYGDNTFSRLIFGKDYYPVRSQVVPIHERKRSGQSGQTSNLTFGPRCATHVIKILSGCVRDSVTDRDRLSTTDTSCIIIIIIIIIITSMCVYNIPTSFPVYCFKSPTTPPPGAIRKTYSFAQVTISSLIYNTICILLL